MRKRNQREFMCEGEKGNSSAVNASTAAAAAEGERRMKRGKE